MSSQRLRLGPDTLRALLEEGDWPCDRISEDAWRSQFRGRNLTSPFYVRLDPEGYVCFVIVPFVKSPDDPERAAALYQRLLELNQSLLMAKFSIDDDFDVVLSVEYPSGELDRSEFDDALDVLCFYADRHYEELRALAE